MDKYINVPLTAETAASLRAGDYVYFRASGCLLYNFLCDYIFIKLVQIIVPFSVCKDKKRIIVHILNIFY